MRSPFQNAIGSCRRSRFVRYCLRDSASRGRRRAAVTVLLIRIRRQTGFAVKLGTISIFRTRVRVVEMLA